MTEDLEQALRQAVAHAEQFIASAAAALPKPTTPDGLVAAAQEAASTLLEERLAFCGSHPERQQARRRLDPLFDLLDRLAAAAAPDRAEPEPEPNEPGPHAAFTLGKGTPLKGAYIISQTRAPHGRLLTPEEQSFISYEQVPQPSASIDDPLTFLPLQYNDQPGTEGDQEDDDD